MDLNGSCCKKYISFAEKSTAIVSKKLTIKKFPVRVHTEQIGIITMED